MPWVREWEKWLAFATGRSSKNNVTTTPAVSTPASDTIVSPQSLTNRECASALGGGVLLGVAMIRPLVSWQENPLNVVNYCAFGRLAWNVSMGTDEIYNEWISLTFPETFQEEVAEQQLMTQLTGQLLPRGQIHCNGNAATEMVIRTGVRDKQADDVATMQSLLTLVLGHKQDRHRGWQVATRRSNAALATILKRIGLVTRWRTFPRAPLF